MTEVFQTKPEASPKDLFYIIRTIWPSEGYHFYEFTIVSHSGNFLYSQSDLRNANFTDLQQLEKYVFGEVRRVLNLNYHIEFDEIDKNWLGLNSSKYPLLIEKMHFDTRNEWLKAYLKMIKENFSK